jgi:microcystin-dependent protein
MAKNAMRKVSNSVSKVVADTKKMSPVNLAILLVSVAIVVVLVVLLVKRSKREGFALMNLSQASWVTKGEDGVDGVDGEDGVDGVDGVAGTDAGFPSGVIVAYNSNIAPVGWTICDGVTRNGVTPPDLRGRFILASGRGVSKTLSDGSKEFLTRRVLDTFGGEENHKLTVEEMPEHDHDHNIFRSGNDSCGNANTFDCGAGGSKAGAALVLAKGGDKPHNNMPPFYVLTYIMKL